MSNAGAARVGARTFRLSSVFFALYLLSMPVYCLVRLSGQQVWIGPSTAFTAISLFAFSLAHCIETRGAWRSLLMLLAGFAIALTTEYLGSTYGLIFGHYDYTDNLGPKVLGKVPVIIPIAWFMMLYPAWNIAELLVAQWTKRNTEYAMHAEHHVLRIAYSVVRIIIAALAMTAWDLSLDPRMVADGNWVWPDGGAYFGIPLSNYAGWFITSALIYCAWQLIGTIIPSSSTPQSSISEPTWFSVRDTRLLPVWAYVVTWLGESLANAVFWGGLAVAGAVFVGMGLFGGPALWIMLRVSRRVAQVA
ncbi:MAG: carotenoid biosynthesis protein [Candidatus Brachytrichaceae bacterium NZ_4S206]|jgi:putative membrane protein